MVGSPQPSTPARARSARPAPAYHARWSRAFPTRSPRRSDSAIGARAPIGVAIGAQIAEPQPASIRTTGVGTKVHRGVNDTRSSVRRGHGVGGYRTRWLERHRLLLTH